MRPTAPTVSLERERIFIMVERENREHNEPDAKKLNPDVDREGLLECSTLIPADLVRAGVHLVRERDLLVIAGWNDSDL